MFTVNLIPAIIGNKNVGYKLIVIKEKLNSLFLAITFTLLQIYSKM